MRKRKSVKPGSKKDERALKQNYSRTKHLNELASQVNTVVRAYYRSFIGKNFYQSVLKRFRREQSDNRFFLLRQLDELNINTGYPIGRYGTPNIHPRVDKQKLLFNVEPQFHPSIQKKQVPEDRKMNCYYYELLLLQWDKTKKPPQVKRQLGDWVDTKSKNCPEFDFVFKKMPGCKHWLLILGLQGGRDKKQFDVLDSQGVHIEIAGSFDKKDLAIVKKQEEERKKRVLVASTADEVEVRVKAKY